MNAGLPTSVGLHVGLVALALFSWGHSTQEAIPSVDAIEVTISDTTQMRLGEKTAKPKDEIVAKETQAAKQERSGERAGASKQEEPPPPPPQAKPEQVASIPKEEPRPEPPKPEVKPTPKVEPPPAEKTAAQKAPEIAKEPPPPKPPEKKEPPKDAAALDKLMKDSKPKEPSKPQLAAAPPAKTPPATQPSTAKSEFSSSAMKDIINKNATGTAQAANAQQASLGTRTGQNAKVAMTVSEIDAFVSKVRTCWNMPPGASEMKISATLRIMLQPDGSVAARPVILGGDANPLGGRFAESAVRAVMLCGPYKLPVEKYQIWKDFDADFPSQPA